MTTTDQQGFFQWTSSQNVSDDLLGKSVEEIREILKERGHKNLGVLMQQLEHDFNIGTVIRNCNAFGCTNVYYYGPSKKWDKRGSVGVYHYTPAKYLSTLEQVRELRQRHTLVALEQGEDSVSIHDFDWPTNALIVIGEERDGVCPELLELCDRKVFIPQRGSVRSLNAGVASGLALFSYDSQHSKRK